MASGFPGSIDSFTNPLTTSALNSPSHAGQHQDLNDAVNKIETYMGLVKVIPTAATNGTINATTGTVTVGNAVASVSVTCFSSLYENYRIVYSGGVASAIGDLALSLGGITTGYYGGQFGATFAAGAFAGRGINNGASWAYAGYHNTALNLLSCDLFGPNAATRKFISAFGQYNNAGSAYSMFFGESTSTTQATAFTLTPSTGTLTGGTIRVYGYRN